MIYSRRAMLRTAVGTAVGCVLNGSGIALTATEGHLPWPMGAAGAVSLTYDDGLASQLDRAVPQLNRRAMAGTFFVTLESVRPRIDEWLGLAASGHELADHTVDHPCDLRRFTPEAFAEREIAPMERWLDQAVGTADLRLYAYPCDATNLGPGSPTSQARRYARLLRNNGIAAARTCEGAPNNPWRARTSPMRLQALSVGYDAFDAQTVIDYLTVAARRGHWAILVFHDIVVADPARGAITAKMHDQILDAIGALPLWPAPMGKVLRHLRLAEDARGSRVIPRS